MKKQHVLRTTSDSLHERLYIEAKRDRNMWSKPLLSLVDKVLTLAGKEKKVPVITLKIHGKHHFWVLVRSDHLVDVAKEVKGKG